MQGRTETKVGKEKKEGKGREGARDRKEKGREARVTGRGKKGSGEGDTHYTNPLLPAPLRVITVFRVIIQAILETVD